MLSLSSFVCEVNSLVNKSSHLVERRDKLSVAIEKSLVTSKSLKMYLYNDVFFISKSGAAFGTINDCRLGKTPSNPVSSFSCCWLCGRMCVLRLITFPS